MTTKIEVREHMTKQMIKDWNDYFTLDGTVVGEIFKDDQTGMLETYGADLDKVYEIRKTKPNYLWTVIDGNDGEIYVTPGFRFVNRIHYMVSTEPWTDEMEDYLYC